MVPFLSPILFLEASLQNGTIRTISWFKWLHGRAIRWRHPDTNPTRASREKKKKISAKSLRSLRRSARDNRFFTVPGRKKNKMEEKHNTAVFASFPPPSFRTPLCPRIRGEKKKDTTKRPTRIGKQKSESAYFQSNGVLSAAVGEASPGVQPRRIWKKGNQVSFPVVHKSGSFHPVLCPSLTVQKKEKQQRNKIRKRKR